MNTLLIYMIKAAFYLGAFYLVYSLFLSRDTMHCRNRIYILVSLAAAFILPLITIQTNRPVNLFFGKTLNEVLVTGTGNEILAGAGSEKTDVNQLLMMIYLAGLMLFFCKLIIDILELALLIMKNRSRKSNVIRFNGLRTAGFSALGFVFINSSLPARDEEEIRKHEQNHLDNFHFIDIIFTEIVRSFQWFNPFMHLFERSLREVHEYEADEGCIRTGIPVISYQRLIMSQVFRSKVFTLMNSFSNPTLIKKRMIMMTKKRSTALANLKILLVLPVLIILLISFSTCAVKKKSAVTSTKVTEAISEAEIPAIVKPEPFVVVEEMPVFPGGDEALLRYIAENTRYPLEARDKGIEGRVIARFAVEADGTVDRITVLKGVDPALDSEAIRVVSSLPGFQPGKQGGREVPVWYMVPINFTLDKGEIAPSPPPPPPPGENRSIPEYYEIVKADPEGAEKSTEPYVVVEEMPQFPGGDGALLAYLSQNTVYPEAARAEKIMGRVIVRFCITETGNVERIEVIKGVHPLLDQEALRVISKLPDFKPGKQKGVPVSVWYMVPITFALNPQNISNELAKPPE